jgi:TfoX/Sxy family transcriptional regulator of competence genes
MGYDEKLADRVRKALAKQRGVIEKEMFGGLAFLLEGKMFVGILKRELMVRVGPKHYPKALAKPHARAMDFTGKPLAGYVFVSPAGVATARSLGSWIEKGREFVARLTAEKPAKSDTQRGKKAAVKKKSTAKARPRARKKPRR